MSPLTKTITTTITQLKSVPTRPGKKPPRTLGPSMLAMTSLVMTVVGTSSSPLSSTAMLAVAASSGVCPASPSSSILVMSDLILFSASYESVKMVAGKTV